MKYCGGEKSHKACAAKSQTASRHHLHRHLQLFKSLWWHALQRNDFAARLGGRIDSLILGFHKKKTVTFFNSHDDKYNLQFNRKLHI
jgi:hypothetical protein